MRISDWSSDVCSSDLKNFGGLCAVDDVSFTVRRGMVLGIIGPNGAGKTTLFNLLNGFLRPDSGAVLLDGRDMVGCKPHLICAAGRSEEHPSQLQSIMRISYAVFCLHKKISIYIN